MQLDDASRAGKPAMRSSSSADDGEPPSKKPKPRFNAHGKYTAVENALEAALAHAIDMGSELKQTSSHLDVAKAELEAYQRRSEKQITSLNRKVDVAQAETARAQPKAAMDVASTAAAKDRELERLQMQLTDAQRKHAAAMGAMGGVEFKAKCQGTLCKQAERRAVSSEKAKSKSDTALEKAQAKSARLRQLKNDSNKRAREAEKKSGRMQRIYEKGTALTGHL